MIDAFRGIAILGVLLFHYTFRWTQAFDPLGAPAPLDLTIRAFRFGWLGVEFFFIISGFVILMTLERCESIWDFAIRRVARIYPAYLVCMILTFVVVAGLGVPLFERNGWDLAAGVTMLPTYLGAQWVDGAYWSLLVELKFYVWIALLYFGLGRWLLAGWTLLCLATVASAVFRSHTTDQFLLGAHIAFFSAGMAFYRLHRDGRLRWGSIWLLVLAAATYLLFWSGRTPVVHLLVAAMVAGFVLRQTGWLDFLAVKPLVFIGLISYPLYLLHQDAGVALIARITQSGFTASWVATVLVAAAMIGAAWLVHRFAEVPLQGWVRATVGRWRFSDSPLLRRPE